MIVRRARSLRLLLPAAVALLACVPVAVAAQRVSGQVKLPGGAPGGGGVLIVARDSGGAEVARAVTSDEGRFAVPLPRPGFYRVELERVGFVPSLVVEKNIVAGEAVTVEANAGATVLTLPRRGDTPPTTCGPSAAGREYVDVLLGELRKTVSAAQLFAARQGVSARWASTDHRLAGNGRDTSRFAIVRRAGNPLAAFGTSFLNEIQRSGYVVRAGQDRMFRGIDYTILTSPWFAENYCFTAREGNAQSFIVSFEPKNRRRETVDINGEIHFTRATLEPSKIEFSYVGLTADESNRGGGGRLTFARAAGGSWIAADWYIRFPQVGYIELETFRSQNQARVMQPEVMGIEVLAWRTTALLEGTRRIYVNDAMADATIEGPIRSACAERVFNGRIGAARGRLTYEGRPVNAATVRASWRTQLDVGGEVPLWRDEVRETLTSRNGDWVLCDLPVTGAVELTWEVLGRKTTTSVRVSRDEVITLDETGKVLAQP